MIHYDELPEGVAVLRVYGRKSALAGACLIECHHDLAHRAESLTGARRTGICRLCRTKCPDRPVKLLARIPAAALKGALRQDVPVVSVQTSLF